MGLPEPYYTDGQVTLYCGDAVALLPEIPSASVQLIITDPPYYKVKGGVYDGERITWDRQWPTASAYLAWLRGLALEWRRILAPNGSLYCFASPQMAAHVEVMLGDVFRVIQRVTWRKPPYSTKAEMFDKDSCRMFFPASEAIVFCEQRGSDAPYAEALIDGNSTYWSACERTKASIFGEYLQAEFTRAGATRKDITALFPSRTGQLTGCLSNWLLGYNIPTREQYHTMRDYLNSRNCRTDYLRREYEDLRREYEDLRREYEDLRRPFTVSPAVPYTDIWDYHTVAAGPGKHPCEKPLPLLRHLIEVSSRPGALVLDCCAGSCSTLEAAVQCGRKAIGIEQAVRWCEQGASRLKQGWLFAGVGT